MKDGAWMRGNFRVGSLLGIPILVNPSWFLLLGLVTFTLATQIYPQALDERSTSTHVLMAVASAMAFFLCVIAHELAHSVVAKLYRIPVKSITLFVFGGVAQITREASRPFSEFLMAVAGPVMSLVLGVVFYGVWWGMGENDSPIDFVLIWLAVMNGVLGVFNLIPAFPMDGGRVFRSLIWMVSGNYNRATNIAGWTGRGFGWVMIATGALAVAGFETYIASEGIGGFWLILIGFFLENAARQSLFQNKLIESLRGVQARDVMTTNAPTIDASVNLRTIANVFDLNPRICYFVEEHGRLAGIVTAYQLADIPEVQWNERTAGEAMLPSGRLRATDPERTLNELLIEMESEDLTHMPVVEGGQVIGILARERILAFLKQKGLLPAS